MIKLPMIFSDHMILQAKQPVPVWGYGDDGSLVTVCFQGQKKTTVVKNGYWRVDLNALRYSKNELLEVFCGIEKFVCTDVAVGEVWFAGGQSNMEFQMRYDYNYQKEYESVNQNIDQRFFDYPETVVLSDLEGDTYADFGIWRKYTKNDLQFFSAVAYYFAKKLAEDTEYVIGIIGCNWGASNCAAWVDPNYLKDTQGDIWLKDYEDAVCYFGEEAIFNNFKKSPMGDRSKPFEDKISEELLFGISHEKQLALLKNMPAATKGPVIPNFAFAPGRLYAMMVKNIAPFAIKGVLWYQGESDSFHADVYDIVMSALIFCWRDLWNAKLPFYFVQLPSFDAWLGADGKCFPIIRKQQEKVEQTVENVYMTASMDCGMQWDIHPKNKRPVGERLEKLVLKHTYGQDILAGSPKVADYSIVDNTVRIHFSCAQGGLLCEDQTVIKKCSQVIVDDMETNDYTVYLDGECLIYQNIKGNIVIRFAQMPYCPVNIFNQAGFSACPFEIYINKNGKNLEVTTNGRQKTGIN